MMRKVNCKRWWVYDFTFRHLLIIYKTSLTETQDFEAIFPSISGKPKRLAARVAKILYVKDQKKTGGMRTTNSVAWFLEKKCK